MRSDCGDGEKGGKLNVTTRGVVAYVAGAKREWGGGRGKPSLPNPPLFPIPPYPLPLSTPATQNRGGVESGTLSFSSSLIFHALLTCCSLRTADIFQVVASLALGERN